MPTTKHKSRILQEVHEMAADLYEIGLIDQCRMREFDALCYFDIKAISPAQQNCNEERNLNTSPTAIPLIRAH